MIQNDLQGTWFIYFLAALPPKILVSWPGTEPSCPLPLECKQGVLTTGPPGKSCLLLKLDVGWSAESSCLYLTKEVGRLYTFMYAEPLWQNT